MLVEFPTNGHTTKGYLATPESGSGPGVLVFQEWWGLVDHIKEMCDRLAAEGFVALAPDMYHGDCTTDPDEAGRMMMALEVPKVAADARGAIEYLRGHEATTGDKVGVMGFCLGGQLALYSACDNPNSVGVCLDFYGVHPNIRPDLDALACPVVGFFAEKDGFVTPEVVDQLAGELKERDKDFQFHRYAGIDHAFMNDTRPDVYDETAAQDAWQNAVVALRSNL